MDPTLGLSQDGSTILIDGGNQTTGGGGTVIAQWKNGVTKQVEFGYPPSTWFLSSDGFWYPSNIPQASSSNTPTAGVKLSDFISISPPITTTFTRTYIKNSEMGIPSQTFSVSNISSNLSINVSFNAIAGMNFTPQSFVLQPLASTSTVLSFDPLQFDTLPEGINASNIIVKLTPGTVINTAVPTSSFIPFPPPPPIVVQPPFVQVTSSLIPVTQSTWKNGVTGQEVSGTPPTDWVLSSNGFWYPPTTPTTITPVISFTELQPTFNSTLNSVTANGQLGVITTPSTNLSSYTIQWNFDVNGQGKGVALTTDTINPVVSWSLTSMDNTSLSSTGTTSRTVSVTISNGANSYSTTKVIQFSSTSLISKIVTGTITSGGTIAI